VASPLPTPVSGQAARDLVNLKEGVQLLAPTGHPVTYKALAHLLTRERVRTTKIRGVIHASASDIFRAHRNYVAGMAAK
jgi:hypothetical protein